MTAVYAITFKIYGILAVFSLEFVGMIMLLNYDKSFAEVIYKGKKKVMTYMGTMPYRMSRKKDEIRDLIDYKLISKNPKQEHFKLLQALQINSISHTKRTLLKHLLGTYKLLKKWGCPESVCLAGLFHSIYGTQDFKNIPISMDLREKIRSAIGSEAERLVYYFCVQDRKHFMSNFERTQNFSLLSRLNSKEIPISEQDFRNLLEIRLADHLEQMLYTKHQYGFKEYFLKAQPYLSQKGFQEFSLAYQQVLR